MSLSPEAMDRELSCRHSRFTFLSFGSARFTMTFVFAPIDLFLLFFYTQVVGLTVIWYTLAIFIFTIWDAVNDPLLAWILDRNFSFTRKTGRRFPWIVIGSLGWGVGLFLLFAVPPLVPASVDPIPTFLWLLFGFFLFDLFGAMAIINIELLRPDKFRTETERRILQGYNTPLSMIAQAMGMLIPPLFITGNTPGDYLFMAIIVMIITFVTVLIYLPGCREDAEVKELYLSDDTPRINIVKGYIEVAKLKSFWLQFLGTVIYMTVNGLTTGMLIFIFTFQFDSPGSLILGLAMWLLAALISVPIWVRIAKKFQDTKKMYTIGMFIYGIAFLVFFFYIDFVTFLILAFILGFTVGNMWTFGPNIYANVMDDFVVKIGKNQKGMVQGFNAIVNRLAAAIDTYLITFVFIITGFVNYSGIPTLSDLQAVASSAEIETFLLGFRLLVSIIPAILLFVGGLVFWKFYPLDKERVIELKEKLVELNL